MLPWLALRSEQPLELFQTPARAAVRFGWLLGFSFCCPAALTARGHRSAAAKQRTASKSDYNAQRCDIWSPAARIHGPSSSPIVEVAKEILSGIRPDYPTKSLLSIPPHGSYLRQSKKNWPHHETKGPIGALPWGNARYAIPLTGRGTRRRGAHCFCRDAVDRRRARGAADGGSA